MAGAFTPAIRALLIESMNLNDNEIDELIYRAERAFKKIKESL